MECIITLSLITMVEHFGDWLGIKLTGTYSTNTSHIKSIIVSHKKLYIGLSTYEGRASKADQGLGTQNVGWGEAA